MGYRLFAAENGRQGLYYALQSLPDAVIVGDGIVDYTPMELCRIFKEDPSLSASPMLHVSINPDPSYKAQAIEAGFRVVLDDSDETLNKKIRNAEKAKITYMMVVGAKEAEAGTVALRRHGKGQVGVLPVDDALAQLTEEKNSRSIADLD